MDHQTFFLSVMQKVMDVACIQWRPERKPSSFEVTSGVMYFCFLRQPFSEGTARSWWRGKPHCVGRLSASSFFSVMKIPAWHIPTLFRNYYMSVRFCACVCGWWRGGGGAYHRFSWSAHLYMLDSTQVCVRGKWKLQASACLSLAAVRNVNIHATIPFLKESMMPAIHENWEERAWVFGSWNIRWDLRVAWAWKFLCKMMWRKDLEGHGS